MLHLQRHNCLFQRGWSNAIFAATTENAGSAGRLLRLIAQDKYYLVKRITCPNRTFGTVTVCVSCRWLSVSTDGDLDITDDVNALHQPLRYQSTKGQTQGTVVAR